MKRGDSGRSGRSATATGASTRNASGGTANPKSAPAKNGPAKSGPAKGASTSAVGGTGSHSVTPTGWKAPSGYSHGVATVDAGRVVVTAGQIGWNPMTGHFESDDFTEQVAQALKNLAAVLTAAGARPEHLVRLTWFITDRDAYLKARKAIGASYKEIIGRHYPAMSVVVVSALVEERAKVEIEGTAVIPR